MAQAFPFGGKQITLTKDNNSVSRTGVAKHQDHFGFRFCAQSVQAHKVKCAVCWISIHITPRVAPSVIVVQAI